MRSSIQDLRDTQQDLSRKIDILNLISAQTDGFRTKSGKNIIYTLTGSQVLSELNIDLGIIGDNLKEYSDQINQIIITESNQYNDNFDFTLPGNTIVNTPEQIRFFMIFGDEVLNNTEELIEEFLGTQSDNENLRNYVTNIIEGTTLTIDNTIIPGFTNPDDPLLNNNTSTTVITGLKYNYDIIFKFSKNIVSTFLNKEDVKQFNSYTPFDPGKERKLNYQREVTNPVQNENYFNTLYKKVNTGESDEFNGKREFN